MGGGKVYTRSALEMGHFTRDRRTAWQSNIHKANERILTGTYSDSAKSPSFIGSRINCLRGMTDDWS